MDRENAKKNTVEIDNRMSYVYSEHLQLNMFCYFKIQSLYLNLREICIHQRAGRHL